MKIPRKASQMVRGSVLFLIVFNVIDVQRHPETVVWIGFLQYLRGRFPFVQYSTLSQAHDSN